MKLLRGWLPVAAIWLAACGGGAQQGDPEKRDSLAQARIDWSDTSHFHEFPEFSDSALKATHDSLMLEIDTSSKEAAVNWLEANEIDTGALGRQFFKVQEGAPDPSKGYFVPVDEEPQLLNVSAVMDAVQVNSELKMRLGPSRVFVKVLIDAAGKPKDYYVYRSPDIRVSKAVLDKIRYLKAKPAKLKGKPVKCWVNVEYNLL